MLNVLLALSEIYLQSIERSDLRANLWVKSHVLHLTLGHDKMKPQKQLSPWARHFLGLCDQILPYV